VQERDIFLGTYLSVIEHAQSVMFSAIAAVCHMLSSNSSNLHRCLEGDGAAGTKVISHADANIPKPTETYQSLACMNMSNEKKGEQTPRCLYKT